MKIAYLICTAVGWLGILKVRSYTSAYIQKAIDGKTVHTLAVKGVAHRLLQVDQLLRRL